MCRMSFLCVIYYDILILKQIMKHVCRNIVISVNSINEMTNDDCVLNINSNVAWRNIINNNDSILFNDNV